MVASSGRRLESLTKERLEELAERDDTSVYTHTHDTVFEPWDAARVKRCLRRIVDVSRRSDTADAARSELLGTTTSNECSEMRAFAELHQRTWERFTDPAVASNEGHVRTYLHMLDTRERLRRGELTSHEAHGVVSETALANLLAQAQGQARATEDE